MITCKNILINNDNMDPFPSKLSDPHKGISLGRNIVHSMHFFECLVCMEDCKTTLAVECYCGSTICKACAKTYIMGKAQEAHCMNCKTAWNYKFLISYFTKTWVSGSGENGYRNHLKNVSLEREISKIPETLENISHYRIIHEDNLRIEELREKRTALKKELRDITKKISTGVYQVYMKGKGTSLKRNRIEFICPCPSKDCKGMIKTQNSQCGVCDIMVCKKCLCIKIEKHTCDKKIVENVKFLRKDTKPCPKCSVPIHKIDGCDSMWCTQCHIGFSWRTGDEETGSVHNPHAIRWLREHGGQERNIEDIPCGGLVSINSITMNIFDRSAATTIECIYRTVAEVNALLVGCIADDEFEGLRADYILGIIPEKMWRQKIYKIERENSRRRACRDIYTTYRTLSVERFRDIQIALKNPSPNEKRKITDEFIQNMETIRIFINEAFVDELRPLGSIKPNQITHGWRWLKNY